MRLTFLAIVGVPATNHYFQGREPQITECRIENFFQQKFNYIQIILWLLRGHEQQPG